MPRLCRTLVLLWTILFLAYLAHAQEVPLDGAISSVSGADWVYIPAAVQIAGQAYQGYGYVADAALPATRAVTLDVRGFARFTALVGVSDAWKRAKGTVSLAVDGKVVATHAVKSGAAATAIEIPLDAATALTITMTDRVLLAQPVLVRAGGPFVENAPPSPPAPVWKRAGLTGAFGYSPDGTHVAFAQGYGVVRLHTMDDLSLVRQHTLDRDAGAVLFSPDGTRLLAATDAGTHVWKVATGEEERILPPGLTTPIFSPDGQYLAIPEKDYAINFYDVATGRCLRTLPAQTGRPTAIAYSPDGSAFAVLRGTDGSASTVLRKAVLTLYQTPDYSVRQTRKISVSVRTQAAIAFTRDGQRLAIAGMLSTQTGNVTKLEDVIEYVPVDAADDNTTMIPVLYGSEARQLLFLDDDTVVVASGLPAEKGWLHRYQADDGKQRGKGIPSWGAVTLTPDGKWLSWIAHGQQLCRQRVTGDPEVLTHRITPLPFHSPVFSRTLDLVAMQDLNSDSVTVLRTRDASDVRTLSFSPAGRLLQTGALAFTADAASLAVKAGHETVIWEMATGMRSRTLRGSDAWNMSLQFSPDGTLLTGVTGDKVLCWEAGTIAELPSVPTIRYTDDYFSSPGFSPLAFSADGTLFATADADKNIVIYRTKDRTPILTITNDRTHFGRIAFSRNGQFLAVALGSGIGVYRVSDGACLQTINRVVPRFLAVSDDGQYLVSTHISQINRWRVKDAVRDYQFDFPANLWIAAMSPDARLFLCKTNENEPPAIQLWQW